MQIRDGEEDLRQEVVLVIGLSGSMRKIVRLIPMPIISAMIVGMLFKYCIGMVSATTQTMPVVAIPVVLTYFLTARFLKKIPPIITALVVGVIVSIATGVIVPAEVSFVFVMPHVFVPSTENLVGTAFAIGLPMALLIMGAENTQAIGVLKSEGYDAPVNAMTVVSGLSGLIAAFFGGHSANIAGPMTAMCATEENGKKEERYAATTMLGVAWVITSLIAPMIASVVSVIPSAVLNVIVGLAVMGLMAGSLKTAFASGKFRMGAVFALATALSNMSLFGITAPFWSLVFGCVVSIIVETGDYKEMLAATKAPAKIPAES